jgi:glycosyltransferase involved in cell wall biosynthesis
MKITLSHSGKQHSYKVAKALLNLDALDCFYTSSYITNAALQSYFLRTQNTYWTRRFEEGLAGDKVQANWRFEVKEMLLRKMYGKNATAQNAVYERDMSFDSYVAEQLHGRKSDVFWGFQGSCHDSLKAAKASGKIAVCELATAHVTEAKRILGEEAQLHPEWADSIDNLVFPAHYEQRLAQEPHLADKVVAASAFTKQTLIAAQIPENKIITLPLGAAIDHVPFQLNSQDKISKRPLKLLYAGTVTQRKGIKYLLEAMKLLEKGTATLEIVGGVQGSGQAFRSYSGYEYRAAVSQMELFQMYRDYDALVLPTVFEGFGLVIVEAMAAGLPVITTSHSIGPDLIKNNENGYIVPIRDTPALVKAIEALRRKSDDEYLAMRVAARQSAEQYSWETYQQRLKLILEKIC